MDNLKAICVYAGSSINVPEIYKDSARKLGRMIAEKNLQVVYGGGRIGLMGLLADSALEAGGDVIGIIPSHLQQWEVEHKGLTELHLVDSMHNRKRLMVERSDAFVALPGGFGTLDETFEIMTWKQVHLHDKPIVIVNQNGYWDKLLELIEHVIVSGFAHESHRKLFKVVSRVEDVFDALSGEHDSVIGPQFKWM